MARLAKGLRGRDAIGAGAGRYWRAEIGGRGRGRGTGLVGGPAVGLGVGVGVGVGVAVVWGSLYSHM